MYMFVCDIYMCVHSLPSICVYIHICVCACDSHAVVIVFPDPVGGCLWASKSLAGRPRPWTPASPETLARPRKCRLLAAASPRDAEIHHAIPV